MQGTIGTPTDEEIFLSPGSLATLVSAAQSKGLT